MNYSRIVFKNSDNEEVLYHHGIKGQKWGIRRFQNYDGSWTALGKMHRVKGLSGSVDISGGGGTKSSDEEEKTDNTEEEEAESEEKVEEEDSPNPFIEAEKHADEVSKRADEFKSEYDELKAVYEGEKSKGFLRSDKKKLKAYKEAADMAYYKWMYLKTYSDEGDASKVDLSNFNTGEYNKTAKEAVRRKKAATEKANSLKSEYEALNKKYEAEKAKKQFADPDKLQEYKEATDAAYSEWQHVQTYLDENDYLKLDAGAKKAKGSTKHEF